jgi:hypothetical protein
VILSGQVYRNNIPISDFLSGTLSGKTIPNVLHANGYAVDLAHALAAYKKGSFSSHYYIPVWKEYSEIRSYDSEDVAGKSEYVEKIIKRLGPKVVWDLGANTGEFSLIAASCGSFVVSIDGDPVCTESLYQKVSRTEGPKGILPLTMDLANPSPPGLAGIAENG